jgi:8-oxo-dGTP pyrophosphatase MutT (NUDIX family)
MLLRDGEHGLEVFLQRRAVGMAFAPDVVAFPGGSVDERDQRCPLSWRGPEPSWWAQRLGCAEGGATALVCAAVRELFEECGVLLAATSAGAPLPADRRELADLRRRLEADRVPLVDLLDAKGWTIRADFLSPWSNWITPEVRPRRYDTRFFVAGVPEGQSADGSTTEAAAVQWCRPREALESSAAGDMRLMLPTRSCLEELTDIPDVAAALHTGHTRPINPIMPTITTRDGQETVTLPGHADTR